MRLTPLDETTMALAQAVVSASRRLGKDPIEELHKHGLIRSPDVRREDQRQVLQTLLDILSHTRPAEMWRRNKNSAETPRAMYDIMVEFIQEYMDAQ
jgi:hypothetical protein